MRGGLRIYHSTLDAAIAEAKNLREIQPHMDLRIMDEHDTVIHSTVMV